ncbi:YjjG family noncanonical pyrimidine nucleotidase [Fluviispira multicolorata]|uniref:Noncanonical pyrimidine nucleotidase, YjjG family n=1 Tax=Fluviispira multicolorata TaxID=2654512 RepID=A0A833JDD4_9BACT|nr:YjjG family noncanonical pyrimidine nucleotidase [Fluviispira multicolorata]KAB8028507.1 noncanonical pyrimidine nucleotidase, YjjG family [Fluviispira multicolorata]
MKYAFVLFDADDTLFDFNKSQEIAFRQTVSHFAISYHTDVLYSEFKKTNRVLWKELENGLISGNDLRISRFERIFDAHNIKQDPKPFSDFYLQKIAQGTHLKAGAYAICEFLKSNQIKIGIITNGFTDIQKSRFSLSELNPFFDFVTISEECGYRKPFEEIFQLALNKFGNARKENTLMVGDNLNADILGAQLFGIDNCWYHPQGGSPHNEITPTYIISELIELKKIINKK